MIQGNKPSNYFVTSRRTPMGTMIKVEGEMRMCAHCSVRWEYRPGSGIRRGYCKRCNGLLCGKGLCMRYCIPYMSKIDAIEKGLKLDDMLKEYDKKYGNKMLNKTREVAE